MARGSAAHTGREGGVTAPWDLPRELLPLDQRGLGGVHLSLRRPTQKHSVNLGGKIQGPDMPRLHRV